MADVEVNQFLTQCRQSGDDAYSALKVVLERLHKEESRSAARVFLASVQRHVDAMDGVDSLATFHFRIDKLSLSDYEGFQEHRQSLTLLELPSIFIPEDWSFTFFEGISRHPDSNFIDRDVAELGCGNGWISIALAEKWTPRKVYGLDINPRAIKAAWINLYLNALNEDGSLIFDHGGKTLLDRVEFHESDLLAYCKDRGILLDWIVGCIPQILNPDPEVMQKIVSENASEEFLYSLSNYCSLQGFVEDQFGLGLVARAVEEGIDAIRPTGVMILNIGGRPGQAVCERLLERRGFHITKLWQTRVKQAADTDILALVKIEKNSRHRFEFFMGKVSQEPICARTAWAYAKAGGEISHGLSVYSCQLQQPNQVKTIFRFLRSGFQDTKGALDLSFKDKAMAEEKIPFLAHLARALEEKPHMPRESAAGSTRFRDLITRFLRLYHNIPIAPTNLIVFPSRSAAIEGFLRLFSPDLVLVDATLTRLLPKKWLNADLPDVENGFLKSSNGNAVVIEVPKRADLVIQLLKHMKPQIVVTSIADFEMRSATAFEQLLDACGRVGTRLLLDISDYIELSSLPGTNGVLEFIADHALPLHASVVCGLVKNKVYSDLEVAFIISENQNLLLALTRTVELIIGRTSVSSQFYYGCLFHELLTFQLPGRYTTAQRLPTYEREATLIKLNANVHTTIEEVERLSSDSKIDDIVHMDSDENLLPVPSAVKMAVFEGFCRQNITDLEMDPAPEILEFISQKLGIPAEFFAELVLSDSSAALFANLVLACVDGKGTLLFPAGSNGNCISAARYLQANVQIIPTKPEEHFKLTLADVEDCLVSIQRPWLYISGPTINSTGQIYSNDEICSILSACQRHGAHVIVDTSFSGLEFNTHMPFTWNLKDAMLRNLEHSPSAVIFMGSSSEVLTGGLELSFAALHDPLSISLFKNATGLRMPHRTLMYTVKKLFSLRNQISNVLHDSLIQQQGVLYKRAHQMVQVLEDCGWDPIQPLGGFSMVARPTAYEDRIICYEDQNGGSKELKLDSKNIKEAIFHITGLYISNSCWTCIPHYCRFTIAIEETNFRKALKSLQEFKNFVFK